MKRKLFITLFLMAIFAGISYISAVACEKKGGSCSTGLLKNLKLTKEQKAKIEEMDVECDKVGDKIHSDIKTTRTDLHANLKKDPIDKAAVDAKVDEMADLIKKALKNKMDCKVKTLSILDAEQKKAYLESADDCCEDGGHHHMCEKSGHDGCEKHGHEGCEKKDKKPCGMKGMDNPEK